MKENIIGIHKTEALEIESKNLYARLLSDAANDNLVIHDLGEGMAVIEQVLGRYWKPRYLINHNTKRAYEFMDESKRLSTITETDIDWDSLIGVQQEIKERAHRLSALFPTHICKFENGVAQVSWQINPDGMYYRDDDGYGMTDDEKIELYGFIDAYGRVVVKFELINENWERLETMQKDAEHTVKI